MVDGRAKQSKCDHKKVALLYTNNGISDIRLDVVRSDLEKLIEGSDEVKEDQGKA
jgi:hypothetical protein